MKKKELQVALNKQSSSITKQMDESADNKPVTTSNKDLQPTKQDNRICSDLPVYLL